MKNLNEIGIHAYGRNHLLVDNYVSILLYTSNKVCLQAKDHRLEIEGAELVIEFFDDYEMQLGGKIERIIFEG